MLVSRICILQLSFIFTNKQTNNGEASKQSSLSVKGTEDSFEASGDEKRTNFYARDGSRIFFVDFFVLVLTTFNYFLDPSLQGHTWSLEEAGSQILAWSHHRLDWYQSNHLHKYCWQISISICEQILKSIHILLIGRATTFTNIKSTNLFKAPHIFNWF